MAKKVNKYQYETSPRKLEPDYLPAKKPKVPKKSAKTKPEVKKKENKKDKSKLQALTSRRQQVEMVVYIIIGFVILFAISYRNSQIDESFAKVQSLKSDLSEIEKQNAQLEISIENVLNLNDIEQQAKELLGMQKLTSKQTIYVSLPKTDYIETVSEEVKLSENVSIFERIKQTIVDIF